LADQSRRIDETNKRDEHKQLEQRVLRLEQEVEEIRRKIAA